MAAKVEAVIEKSCLTIGEGPHWDERTQTLLYVDINDGSVHRWSPETGKDEKHKFDTFCSLVVPCKKGGYLVSVGNSVCHFDWDTKKLTTLQTVDEGKETRINDGKCDASGRLWFGTMGLEKTPAVVNKHQGSLFSLEIDGSVKKHKEGVSISNGLAWTADNKTMYYIDSIPRKVFGYDFDIKTGTMSNERVVVDLGGEDTIPTLGFPDGMTIDTDGKLWVACFFAGKVFRFDPETGKQIGAIDVPAKRTTSCCFGGKNFDEMYITCSLYGVTEDELKETPLAGSVFRATGLGAKGTPAPVYEG
ncbi:regucalcin-like [Mercenaria mercenaria]|uniref:regucalcin-like n=1 Tax=Mercenaria mercenaria TaxID=6596 RepID=UPI00234E6515|nr:regucalcin-like [Mercenaria mercenaria]